MGDRTSASILIPPNVTVAEGIDRTRIDAYWKAVRETLERVFHEADAAELAVSARRRLEEQATAETQQYFYHASPFAIASDLAGVTETGLSAMQISAYREIIAAFDPVSYPPPP